MKWPHVVGVRNGELYQYACKLPSIVRDVLDHCTEDPRSYYRMPYASSTTWPVTQGAGGSVSHSNAYAWDFGGPDQATIYATRGGTVLVASMGAPANHNCYDSGQGACVKPCNTNAVTIEHQDGTVSQHYHMRPQDVLVSKGDRVYPGDAIARIGNVGCSTGPHLHYHVYNYLDPDANKKGPSIPIAFETDPTSCVVPVLGDELGSTNQLWFHLP